MHVKVISLFLILNCLISAFHSINIVSIDNLNEAKQPVKRDVTSTNNLFIELLLVVDSGTYNYFVDLYGAGAANENVKLYSTELVKGINRRFQYSLANDPHLKISVSLSNVLILSNPIYTQWTNATLCGVPGYSTYGGKIPLMNTCSLSEFQNYMNALVPSLSFNYDAAIALFSPNLDLWETSSESAALRSSPFGVAPVGSICGNTRYGVLEYNGLLETITSMAHTLGHMLGAVHDQTGTASSCLAGWNNIMTPSVGSYSNATNLFYYSNCSTNSFKQTLLSSDYKNVSPTGACLLNVPITAITSPYQLPGQYYTQLQQCQFSNGKNSTNVGCNAGSFTTCETINCRITTMSGGLACKYTAGFGNLEGTPCKVKAPNSGAKYVCYQGQCVNTASLVNIIESNNQINPCQTNPCKNNGVCTNSPVSGFTCRCSDNTLYADLLCSVSVSLSQVRTTTTTTTTKKSPTTVKKASSG